MANKRTHIVIPEELATAIDDVVGKRGRSKLLVQAGWREVKRLRLIRALDRAAGSWKDKDYPHLKHGAARWVRKMRRESETRFRRLFPRRRR